MSREKREEKKQKKRRKKKKKISKLFISTAAFFSAAVVVVFCIYHVAFKTDFLNIKSVDIAGNKYYEKNYIKEKSEIKLGEKIYNVDRRKVKEKLEKEIYVKNAMVVYEFPNRIYIELTDRNEEYQVLFNNEYIATDDEGIILNIYNKQNELLTIESLTNVIYNIGDKIQFEGIDNLTAIFDTIKYINSQFGDKTITKLTVVGGNSVVLDTEYGTKIKINLCADTKYQISFAIKIITERLNNNFTVSAGLIDFTKGDSPVYIEDYQMEEKK